MAPRKQGNQPKKPTFPLTLSESFSLNFNEFLYDYFYKEN